MRLSRDTTAAAAFLHFLTRALAVPLSQQTPLVSKAGEAAAIPTWDVQSSTLASSSSSSRGSVDLAALSRPGAPSFSAPSWHHVPVSRCTVMGCLLAAGIYSEADLFFSDRLTTVDQRQFQVPWLYRSEFSLTTRPTNATQKQKQYYVLETNGISSRADLYLNGIQVANATLQSGAYGGHLYDISDMVTKGITSSNGTANVLLVQAYPTNYMRDFGLGFVDWNPYPPDNGTGVWRDVTVRQTGAVAIEQLRVTTNLSFSSATASTGRVVLRATVRNLDKADSVRFSAAATIGRKEGGNTTSSSLVRLAMPEAQQLAAGQSTTITLTSAEISHPDIWWPRQWGEQPLYEAQLDVLVGEEDKSHLSDTAAKTFGFRTVTATVSREDDILFRINGRPFEIMGGGYTSDMFLRWDSARFEAQARHTLDMGLNTIRLEGKMEQPELYEITDRLGLLVLPGWECCDKWEAWPYNDNLQPMQPGMAWTDGDYNTAATSMRHEAVMMQAHPSLVGFLVGSDSWPDSRATTLYRQALDDAGWQVPVVASAAKGGYSAALGPGGMKMTGPYDWVPPAYWYNVQPASDDERYGAAFGFGSEQGAGVGTPELDSLRRFLSTADLADLWQKPRKDGYYHMSTAVSSFHDRKIYNTALRQRYGSAAFSSLEAYVAYAQMADYEATRSMFDAFSAYWSPTATSASRPATGVIYWMLNSAWPALHWSLFDYYLAPAGAYYGVKTALGRPETAVYDYQHRAVVLVNRSRDPIAAARSVRAELISGDGRALGNVTATVAASSTSTTTQTVITSMPGIASLTDVAFLRLTVWDTDAANRQGSSTSNDEMTNVPLGRSVYWLGPGSDTLDWDASNWFYTPMSSYMDLSGLGRLAAANVTVSMDAVAENSRDSYRRTDRRRVTLENHSNVPAVFIRLALVDATGNETAATTHVLWTDNYVTLWPKERLVLYVEPLENDHNHTLGTSVAIAVSGRNVAKATVPL